ncbi:MAG: hypothetical protein ACI8Y4_003571 [Candidatus Poriferisodalaceae bacterium]|jgi:peroxiredoxin
MTLAVGNALTAIAGKNVDGEDVNINDLVGDGWSVVLLYRGHW